MQQVMGAAGKNTPTPGQFNPQSMSQIMNGGINPNQAAAALGHSTGIIGKTLSAGWGALQDVSHGVQKGVESTEVGLGTLAGKALGNQGMVNSLQGFKENNLQPKNLGETIGKTGEQVGEFFAPGGAEKKLATKASSLITGAGKVANLAKAGIKGLTSALSFGGVTAAQTGDMGKAEGAAELGGALGTAGGLIEHFGPGIAQSLQKADFRLTPMREAKASKIAENAAGFMSKNNIVGSPEVKFAKLQKINQDMEGALQSSLPKGVTVSKASIADNINANVEALRGSDEAVYNQARSKADEALSLLQERDGSSLEVKDALSAKRSWGGMAFKTSKKAKIDPTVSSEGSYAIEQGYQKALEDSLNDSGTSIKIPSAMQGYFGGASETSLSDFNKVYSQSINAKSLTGIAQYRNDAGLFGRLFGLWAGKAIGQSIAPGLMGEIVGAGVGEAAATKLPGMLRNVGERAVGYPELPGAVGKGAQAMENQ